VKHDIEIAFGIAFALLLLGFLLLPVSAFVSTMLTLAGALIILSIIFLALVEKYKERS
jgi:hypothetical protein